MSSKNNKDRPTRRIRRKLQFSPRKILRPLVIPSAPPPSPTSITSVNNFNINNSVFPKRCVNLPPLCPTPHSPETHKDSPSPVVLKAVDDDDDNVRSSENNQIEGGGKKEQENKETKDNCERELKYFCPSEIYIPRHENLPPPTPPAETHQNSPRDKRTSNKPQLENIEAKINFRN